MMMMILMSNLDNSSHFGGVSVQLVFLVGVLYMPSRLHGFVRRLIITLFNSEGT
jgi:hypothetical protein